MVHFNATPLRITRRPPRSTPSQRYGDVAWHAVRETDDLGLELVAARFEVLVPQLKDFLGDAGERLLPARFLLIDGAPTVSAQRVGETVHLDLALTVVDGPLDQFQATPDALFIRNSGRFREVIEQRLFFGLGLRIPA